MSRTALFCCFCLAGAALLSPALAATDDYHLSGPYSHDNLAIFLIHGDRNGPARTFLTLQEAMDQKKVAVYETGNVNELSIENLSSDDVYIQSGDIVKGGRQDRVFPDDFVLPSHSGKVPISSFCVEHGRWTKRGGEAADRFSSSNHAVALKSLKLAAHGNGGQQEVWRQVARAQASMAGGISASVAAPASPTSMQLALENRQVNEAAENYIRNLSKIIDGKTDVVGYAFAINGKVNSADIYASHDLFRRMWPKLLKSSAVEALAERGQTKTSPAPEVSAVRNALADAERGRESSKDVARRLQIVKKESDSAMFFETRDRDQRGAWVHKSLIMK